MTSNPTTVGPDTTLKDGSVLFTQSLQSQANQHAPLVICFHGSGGDACSSWAAFIRELKLHYRVVLFDRSETATVPEHTNTLLNHLQQRDAAGRCILVAHSYGGTFAKQFLISKPKKVAGMVLVETGKAPEPSLPKGSRWNDGIGRLGAKPLAVITGNSLLWKRKDLEASLGTGGLSTDVQDLHWQQLEDAEKQDLDFERAQLHMSKNAKHIHLPDCRHNVVRDRPDVVLEAVHWVVGGILESKDDPSWKAGLRRLLDIWS